MSNNPSDVGQVSEIITPGPAARLAAILDLDPPDEELPELWHLGYLLEAPRSSDLGPEGHPRLGFPTPPAEGMRRMFAGGRIDTHRRLRFSRPATRTIQVTSQVEKTGRSGPLTFVTTRAHIVQDGELCIVEEQDILYRPAPPEHQPTSPAPQPQPHDDDTIELPDREARLDMAVDEALLFRFSAVTFNAHRIHYDREWVRAEGYDDLLVHGPLQALMMGELARRHGHPLVGRRFSYRLIAPMTGAQTMHILAADTGLTAGAEVRDRRGTITATATYDPSPQQAGVR
ncbi:Mesaconyl-C(4)-CoA hydratase [Austwickia sp. TVS 96-490-7B]|uniref:mesaconyl-C4 CoA hydratase n=1 Tax=Austwickia sp. TVS 96-490-7B TaxID=2830843 RepID=UPI001C56D45B|nr:mesaconyl-C4 CoA hydratase [Austwickia sp. TVS 96-490-7B]MBW3086686.1 Mesaconyl-C(4)-CoA hydratase [Austwickia sp. TVS 96-490-7B]